MTTRLSDEFMRHMASEEAWKNLSLGMQWTEALLEKYQDKVDWNEVSQNTNIMWTVPMLHKFEKRINWKKLSASIDSSQFNPIILEEFKDRWDWHELSDNSDFELSFELIDKYIDRWDWSAIINRRYYHTDLDNRNIIAIYERYKDHIPLSKLQDSNLWNHIVSETEEQLKSEILS